MARERKRAADLAASWRVYIRGARLTKEFWVDLKEMFGTTTESTSERHGS